MSVRYEMNWMNCSPTSRPSSATIHNRCRLALLVLTVALVSLSAVTSLAQTSQQRDAITVEGTVRSSAGAPVAGASVWLQGQGQSKPVETKTNPDGSFVFSPGRAGTYTVWAEKSGLRSRVSDSLVLSAGDKRRVDLILANAPGASMELKDEPNFTVAGVTDWSNVGLHGSDTNSRTSEALAKDTLTLKSGAPEKKSAGASAGTPAGKYEPALECSAKGDFVQAREQVRKALASEDDEEGHRLLGDLDERLGDPLDAVREYERAARMYPSEQNYFDWGTELLLHKAAQPAVEVFTAGSDKHPSSSRMLAGLGAALYASGSYDEAARRLCDASDLRPADPAPYLFLGKMAKTAPAPLPCSEEKLARFARDQPANALANYYYALALWKGQRGSENPAGLQRAEALLEKAVMLDPRLGEAYVQLGILYSDRGGFQQAIQVYKKAIAVSPDLGEAHYRLSLAYKRIGEESKAHEELQAYERVEKTETAAIEQQRRELRQFLIILKDQPAAPAPR